MFVTNVELVEKLGIPPNGLVGRTALITGGARGIGEATAVTMAHLGARIVVVDVSPGGQEVVDAINGEGGQARFIQCDLSDVEQLMEMIPQAEAAFGPIDILLNNALYLHAAPIVNFELDEWERTFDTNARAPFLLIKHLLPGMLDRQHGVIVNMIAYEGSPMAAAYSGTKMALRSLAYTVAREIGNESGVSVFSFVPGIVDTPLVHDEIVPKAAAAFGITEEEVVPIIAQNPGYEGLIPVDQCATALVHAIVNAAEYHAQVADPFEPLDRAGIINMPRVENSADIDVSGPLSGIYIREYLGEVSSVNKELEHRIAVRTRELAEERDRSEQLLLSILPTPIARRLEEGEELIADYFDSATVMFADIVGFTSLSARLKPSKVVEVLNTLFSELDAISDRYEVEKIKTIGDSYMAVGGVPLRQGDHAERVANVALEMMPRIEQLGRTMNLPLSARIGLHSGDLVAGVIGRRKFIYDLWGDTVNTASRMESHGVSGRIQVSEEVRSLLGDKFQLEHRGEIEIKGKGNMSTYFLTGVR
ncbi:MAG: SDR family NAD(P)-dependent oxidoreductase [Acidimicrobiia bacterium]|jgi:class 3 adenylate cyclase/NAD(P)-dependent dehydrogenase (short-subunit alcohol dehydrogenase family)